MPFCPRVGCFSEGLKHPSREVWCKHYFTHFWMYGVLCYIFACFIYSVCTAHAVPWWEQKFSTETMCVCWLLLGRIISLVKNAQYASNQSKRGQPEKYQPKLSRVCGAELDAKPWRCEDVCQMAPSILFQWDISNFNGPFDNLNAPKGRKWDIAFKCIFVWCVFNNGVLLSAYCLVHVHAK